MPEPMRPRLDCCGRAVPDALHDHCLRCHRDISQAEWDCPWCGPVETAPANPPSELSCSTPRVQQAGGLMIFEDRVINFVCRTIGCSSPWSKFSGWPHRFVCTPIENFCDKKRGTRWKS